MEAACRFRRKSGYENCRLRRRNCVNQLSEDRECSSVQRSFTHRSANGKGTRLDTMSDSKKTNIYAMEKRKLPRKNRLSSDLVPFTERNMSHPLARLITSRKTMERRETKYRRYVTAIVTRLYRSADCAMLRVSLTVDKAGMPADLYSSR